MIFDEATSALGFLFRENGAKGVSEVCHINTQPLVIAHRLSTIVDADQIIVLGNGTIAEQGKHQAVARSKWPICKTLANTSQQARSDLA